MINIEDKMRLSEVLLKNIKKELPRLEDFLRSINAHWCYEDLIYRFYHQSYKVYYRFPIKEAIDILNSLSPMAPGDIPNLPNHPFLKSILAAVPLGFVQSHNDDWCKYTRPIVEVSLHLKYFIEMAVKYGKELDKAPDMMPSGWAALLYYYGLR